MAVSNANYEFIMVDVGDSGRNSDGGVLANSNIGEVILGEKNVLNLPAPESITFANKFFRMSLWAMKHFPSEPIS